MAPDGSKMRNALAVADGDREEIRYFGEADVAIERMRWLVKRLAVEQARVQFCYEAGLTRKSLHHLSTDLGHS